MFALLSELKLWTLSEDVSIKDTDFGAFRYYDKRIENVYAEGKRSYCEKRGMIYTPQNKKGIKLKDSLKYLEEQLKDHSTIYCQWNDHCTVTLMLESGLLIYIQISVQSSDIEKIVFDKYLVGKLSEHIVDVIITNNHLVCTYNDSQVSFVHLTKSKKNFLEKISRLEPKINSFELCGPSSRRLDKKIQTNRTGDLILIWWKSAMNEIFPWSPTIKEQDRANVQIYRLSGTKMELICYLRTEYDPLRINFNSYHENVIHSIEQKVSRKGEVTIEWRTYEVSQQDKLQRIAVVSISIPTHTSCTKFSPNQEMMLICCIDGSITLHDQTKGISNTAKAAFIPTFASWHSDGMIFAVGNEKGQLQHFDIALSCIRNQMLTEEATPTNVLDLSSYFRNQPVLFRMEWSKSLEPEFNMQLYKPSDALFLLLFERGPMGVLRIIEGSNLLGDILVDRYLELDQADKATSLLLSMNWDIHPKSCIYSLNQIVNTLFKFPLTPEREHLIQNALGSFHVPIRPISQIVDEEYGDEIRDLTRRFFHHLLRFKLFEKAFRLAIDLDDHDLFMDIHYYAVAMKNTELANAAKEKAEEILSRSNSCNSSHSTCSRASCSLCSDSVSEKEDDSYTEESENEDSAKMDKMNFNLTKNRTKACNSQAPPLPVLHSSLYNNSNFVSSSFNDPIYEKPDTNLRTTSFNLPSYSPGSFNNLLHPNIALSKNPTRNSNFSQSLSNIEKLMPPFANLSLHPKNFNSIETFGKSFDDFGKSFDDFGKSTFSDEAFGKPSFVDDTFEKCFNKDKIGKEKPSIEKLTKEKMSIDKLSKDKVPIEKLSKEKMLKEKLAKEKLSIEKCKEKMSTEKCKEKMSMEKSKEKMSMEKCKEKMSMEKCKEKMSMEKSKEKMSEKSKEKLPVEKKEKLSTERCKEKFSKEKLSLEKLTKEKLFLEKLTKEKDESKAFLDKNFPGPSALEIPEDHNNLPFNGKPRSLFANPVSSLLYNSSSVKSSFDSEDEDEDEDDEEENVNFNSSAKLNSTNCGYSSPVFQTIEQKKSQRISPFDIPPPPSMSTSLANYIQNLPKKNYPLSRSTPGLAEMEDSVLRLQNSRSICKSGPTAQKQSAALNFLQSQRAFQTTRNYRFNYDLNTGSCDNIVRNIYQGKNFADPKESRLFRMGLKDAKKFSNVPPLPVINPSFKNSTMEVPGYKNSTMEVPGYKNSTMEVPGYKNSTMEVPGYKNLTTEVPGYKNLTMEVPGYKNLTMEVPGYKNLTMEVPGYKNLTMEVPGYKNSTLEVPGYKNSTLEVPGFKNSTIEVPGYKNSSMEIPGYKNLTMEVPGYKNLTMEIPGYKNSTEVPGYKNLTMEVAGYKNSPVEVPGFKNSTMEVHNMSEKPKVKFSDTVTHILVPGSGQVQKRPIQKRSTLQLHPMDPKRELAESLPLCLGNDDYLKDFQPLSKDQSQKMKEPPKGEETAKIKVVHFGLL